MTLPEGPLLILGSTSEIGGDLARELADSRSVVLAARRPDALGDLCTSLRSRGAHDVHVIPFEATETDAAASAISYVRRLTGRSPAIAVVCFGILGNHRWAQNDESHAAQIATINYTA